MPVNYKNLLSSGLYVINCNPPLEKYSLKDFKRFAWLVFYRSLTIDKYYFECSWKERLTQFWEPKNCNLSLSRYAPRGIATRSSRIQSLWTERLLQRLNYFVFTYSIWSTSIQWRRGKKSRSKHARIGNDRDFGRREGNKENGQYFRKQRFSS